MFSFQREEQENVRRNQTKARLKANMAKKKPKKPYIM
jgi:hypothetical protein